ncbi:HAD hydrolase-like protein [Bombilactobacillus folatiphilus]|uniref:HAD hydrolase-like protein n=1 Tax=Bombilactobacillus folatiphilus TaxID=2923362 RepID=A0ABY4P8I6_9LACO|nr:HAD hydrolase-like protein [Bombilactobacillus folatiphilus]UQS82023.1 HAD hydrolase-like protein [Bombilactobacillus folatiphilus]
MFENIFFDLDGTLINSGPGIMNSLKYAYQKAGLEVLADSVLKKFIGPPLADSLEKYSQIDAHSSLAKQLIADFQEYYGQKGWQELALYPEITQMLEQLLQNGKQLYITTAKPEKFAKQIINNLGLMSKFRGIYGADLSETMKKKDIIAQALRQNDLQSAQTIMIGDRNTDVFGAKANQVSTIGVLYGYGTAQELQMAGVVDLIAQPLELVEKV